MNELPKIKEKEEIKITHITCNYEGEIILLTIEYNHSL